MGIEVISDIHTCPGFCATNVWFSTLSWTGSLWFELVVALYLRTDGISTLPLASHERPFFAKHRSHPFVTPVWFWDFQKAFSTAHRCHRSYFSAPCGGGSVCSPDTSTTDNNRSKIHPAVGTSSGPKTRSGVHGWTGTLLPVEGVDAHGFFKIAFSSSKSRMRFCKSRSSLSSGFRFPLPTKAWFGSSLYCATHPYNVFEEIPSSRAIWVMGFPDS